MSRMANRCWLTCCALVIGWASASIAGDLGSTNGEVGTFLEAVTRAKNAAPQNFALAIPGFTANGRDYRLDCLVGTFRRNSEPFNPRKGVRGRITADVHVCDLGVEPIDCTGVLRVLERKFKTDAGGFFGAGVDITSEQLGSLLDGFPDSAHPNVIVTSRFTNRKKVGAYTLGCHIGPPPGG